MNIEVMMVEDLYSSRRAFKCLLKYGILKALGNHFMYFVLYMCIKWVSFEGCKDIGLNALMFWLKATHLLSIIDLIIKA